MNIDSLRTALGIHNCETLQVFNSKARLNFYSYTTMLEA